MDAYKEYMRKKILEKMSDEERFMYFMMTEQEKEARNIHMELQNIESLVKKNKYSFSTDLLANITGNVITDSAIYLLSRLFKRL